MKQILQNYKSGELLLAEVPSPAIKNNGIIVETKCSIISAGTEKQMIQLAQKTLIGKARSRPDLVKRVIQKAKNEGMINTFLQAMNKLNIPIPLGYSCSGIITEVGKNVNNFKVGDRVACGGAGYASHSEMNYVPQNLCTKIPFIKGSNEYINYDEAAFTTLGAIAIQGIRQADAQIGSKIVVIGLGLIGQITVQLLKASGCLVLASDIDKAKCNQALENGANNAVLTERVREESLNFTSGYGADVVIITASTKSNEIINLAGEISRKKGRVIVVGFIGMDIIQRLYYEKELDLRLSMSYGPGRYDTRYEEDGIDYPYSYVRWTEQRNMESILQLISEGKLDVKNLITHRYPFEEALGAYSLLSSKEDFIGILLDYQSISAKKQSKTILLGNNEIKADDKIGIGIIGVGSFSKGTLLPAITKYKEKEFIGIVSTTGLSCTSTGKKYSFKYATTDLDKVFNDPEISVVFIVTRHNLHAQLVIKAIKARKHVFVEKPLCVNEEELSEIFEVLSKNTTKRLLVGYNRRFSPYSIKLKSHFANVKPLFINYRINAGSLPPDHWFYSDEGCGRIISEVIHFIDYSIFLTDSTPSKVFCETVGNIGGLNPEDNINLTMKFNDGSISTISYTSLGDQLLPKEYIEVYGGSSVGILYDFKRLDIIKNGKRKRYTGTRQRKGHIEEIAGFFNTIRNGGHPLITKEELFTAALTSFKAQESLKLGKQVEIA